VCSRRYQSRRQRPPRHPQPLTWMTGAPPGEGGVVGRVRCPWEGGSGSGGWFPRPALRPPEPATAGTVIARAHSPAPSMIALGCLRREGRGCGGSAPAGSNRPSGASVLPGSRRARLGRGWGVSVGRAGRSQAAPGVAGGGWVPEILPAKRFGRILGCPPQSAAGGPPGWLPPVDRATGTPTDRRRRTRHSWHGGPCVSPDGRGDVQASRCWVRSSIRARSSATRSRCSWARSASRRRYSSTWAR